MKPTLTPLIFLIEVPGRSVSAVVLADDVGREPLEVGTGVRRLREVAAVDRVAAAVLHAEQLVRALVELVVADGADVEAHLVERLDRGLVVEHARQERRAADEVPGRDRQAAGVAGLLAQRAERRGEVLGAADGRLARVLDGGELRVGGLEVPVVVVERQQLHRRRRLGGLGAVGGRRGCRQGRGAGHRRDRRAGSARGEERHANSCCGPSAVCLPGEPSADYRRPRPSCLTALTSVSRSA